MKHERLPHALRTIPQLGARRALEQARPPLWWNGEWMEIDEWLEHDAARLRGLTDEVERLEQDGSPTALLDLDDRGS